MNLLYLPIGAALVLVSMTGAAGAFASTLAFRRLWRPDVTPELKELANQTARRLGALYALILALAFNTRADATGRWSLWGHSRSANALTTSNRLSQVVEAVGIENIRFRADSRNYG